MKKAVLFVLLSVYVIADATIFVYHRFGDSRYPSTNTPMDELRAEFEYFKQHGYQVVPLSKVVDALHEGKEIDEKWVVLTIDDSYKSFYENGLEVFKEYDYPFTLFVQSETVLWKNSKEYMNEKMVQEAAKFGEIGCHSHKHDYLPTKQLDYIKKDTQKCQDILSGILPYTPRYYAYPYGSYNKEVKQAIKDFGFEAILNQSNGSVNAKSDPYNLFRMALVGEIDNFGAKFGWDYLDVQWEPAYYPKDGVLKEIEASVEKGVNNVQIFVSDHGWSDWIEVKKGKVRHTLDLKLQRDLVRVFMKDENNRFSSIILTKGDIYAK
ncbi:MAG: polysaccharide deacetylase family protein [Campylobacterota bacterium]